ncbi:hypothetical protein Tco_0926084 [Tanacetum coccineum]|uniref:Uncharacterized protein n=1 Tax=Tanacetum coccineum TaxID=301880 RepID=A0ABQ5D9X2_9ASTR
MLTLIQHRLSVMIGWLEENDGVNECVNNEDIEDEDVEIKLDDDAELIFPYEVEGDKTLPHGERLKVLESSENATSKKKLVEAEMKLELACIEHDMVERRLHASYGWNQEFYMEMVRLGLFLSRHPYDDGFSMRVRERNRKNSTLTRSGGTIPRHVDHIVTLIVD